MSYCTKKNITRLRVLLFMHAGLAFECKKQFSILLLAQEVDFFIEGQVRSILKALLLTAGIYGRFRNNNNAQCCGDVKSSGN